MILSKLLRSAVSYQTAFAQSVNDPLAYWREEAKNIKWQTFPSTMLRVEDLHFHKWYPNGRLNISESCLDVHLQDRSDQVAFFYESPVTQQRSQITYGEFHKRVEQFAGALKEQFKVKPGDRVVIYMPMTIESLIAVHACARIAATHNIIFGGFSAHQLANRIQDSEPKLIICANAGKQPTRVINYLQIVDQALKMCNKQLMPKIIHQRTNLVPSKPLKPTQFDFNMVQQAGYTSSPVIVNANHPLYILYTSGTTGKPKGIVRDHGGTAVVLHHGMKRVFNGKAGESMFCSSDIGWVLGHSYIIYAPLIMGMKSVIFQGKPVGTPGPQVFWELISRLKINHLYTSPTAIRSIRKQDSEGKLIKQHNMDSLKSLAIVGQRCDVNTFKWVQDHFKKQLAIDTYWQTETGSFILSNYLGFEQPFKERPGSVGKPCPGYNLKVMNSSTGQECQPGQTGTLYCKQPLPPSFMLTILNHNETYLQKYFSTIPGHYNTGDSGYKDQDGYVYIMSREDDVINTAGHRLSTGQMQQILMKHNQIAQAIVIGVIDQIKGEIPTAFVTIKLEHIDTHCPLAIAKESVNLIREHIGPVASFKHCHVVARLPKTRSGKYLRQIVRKMFNKQPYDTPSTIEDPDVVVELDLHIKKIHKDS